jgi:hypothetical protein
VSWDRKQRGRRAGYFYLSRRSGDQTFKEYVGVGQTAIVVARAVERRKRERDEARLARLRAAEADRLVAVALRLAVLLARAELLLAGLYRHHGGGQWRRRRGGRAVA